MSTEVPKAILYSYPQSVWATVPRLCLVEKGYGEDEYVVKQVDITKGENFAPSYLKLNMNGTIPTLVVPTIETTGTDVDTRFRSLRDTITICDFLDQARSAHTSRTTSDKPAPALSPATIEGKATSDSIISLVHLPTADPNFLALACRTPEELTKKSKSQVGIMLRDREAALTKYISEAKNLASSQPASNSWEQKMVNFLEEKQKANLVLLEVYDGKAGKEKEIAFFDASNKSWNEGVPDVLAKLEETIKGVYTLGDQVSLADFHVISWLARVVELAGGTKDAKGIEVLKGVGPKMKAFWAAWIERESFKKVYADGLH